MTPQDYDQRRPVKSILMVSFYAPARGHAGGLRLLNLYRELRKLRPDLYLALLTFEHEFEDWGGECVEHIFDEVHRLPLDQFGSDLIADIPFTHPEFDFIDLQYHQCGGLINACRKRWSKAVIAFSPMESMIRACKPLQGKGWGTHRFRKIAAALWLAHQEKSYIRAADRVITVSAPDHDVLVPFKTSGTVFCVPTGVSVDELSAEELRREPDEDAIVVFFAYFGSKTNREALLWFCKEVHPRIRKQVASYRLRVVGRGLTQELKEICAGDRIEFVGPVECIQDGLNSAFVGVAPALSGAGVRGKIHQYSAMGIPSVASPLACEGLDYRDGVSILMAEDSAAFASACTKLLQCPELRDQMGKRARQVCIEQYTWSSMEKQVLSAYGV